MRPLRLPGFVALGRVWSLLRGIDFAATHAIGACVLVVGLVAIAIGIVTAELSGTPPQQKADYAFGIAAIIMLCSADLWILRMLAEWPISYFRERRKNKPEPTDPKGNENAATNVIELSAYR